MMNILVLLIIFLPPPTRCVLTGIVTLFIPFSCLIVHAFFYTLRHSGHLGRGYFVLLENTLFDELCGCRPFLQFVLQRVFKLRAFQGLLSGLESWCDIGAGQDVALDEFLALGASIERLFEGFLCGLRDWMSVGCFRHDG